MIAKTEQLIPIMRAPERFPVTPSRTTMYRYIQGGVRGVQLETTMVGGRRYTSAEAIDRFLAALNAPKGGGNQA